MELITSKRREVDKNRGLKRMSIRYGLESLSSHLQVKLTKNHKKVNKH
ncbi:hypothetical protein FORC82_p221 (plasmid) [Escherichia coli]|uniref:Uncharacterized protein n=3 Tax=Enterobacteriaceae TaxID=543 RepID=A0A3T0VC65_ECOLX|nr:hypothetical protein [Escherichia coli O157]AZZ87653.1 hypothetical protein [Escherichia coli]QAX88604.1 hypothetical protein [Klebsiella pneumoniae]UMW97089.1 hypothetical protein [Salmonella enterica subsp. enterica serovar Typhimurium]QAZ74742.1 hypothetical protein FORC82_p221 [Escherichia coli]